MAHRVVVCEDSPGYLLLLKMWLDEDTRFELVGEADNADDAVAVVRRSQPDVVVVDHLLPRAGEGSPFAAVLRAAAPSAKIVLMSGLSSHVLAQVAAASGVDAYASKNQDVGALLAVVDAAVAPDS